MPSIPSSSYQHDDKNYHLNDLHQAMQYNVNGEPEIRVHASGITLSGNVSIGDVTIDNTVDNPVPVTIQNDCLSVQNCEGTTLSVSQGSNPWIISRNDQPNALGNEIFVKLTNDVVTVNLNNECLSVQNCAGTRLNTNSNSIIMLNELPVGGLNPFPVNITNTCLSVQNCGTDGVLNVSGAITVEGVAVTVENPFPVDLRNTCIGVENCEGTVLNVAGNISILSGEDPVSLLNPLPVNLTNECLSVQNCSGTRLNVNSNAIILINELPVAENNPFPVNITDTCLSVQNCGPDGVLNVSGAITVEGVEVTVETPFPVDLRNECLSVQNCAGTQLSVKLSDGVNNIGFVVNDNDGQSPGTYSVPVENFNMIWNGASWDRMPGNAISGVAVNITNSCLSVANCAESVLAIAGDVNVQIGGVDVSADNPVPVTIPNCVSIQNCGETTLGINGNVGLVYDNQVVDEGHPLPVTGSVDATINGTVEVMPGGASSVSAFGEPYGITIQPVLQLDSIYGVTSEVIQTYTSGTGSAVVPPTVPVWTVNSGTTSGSYGVLRSKRFLRYRPGQGALTRFTAAFTPNTANSYQFAGMFNLENQIGIGWRTDSTTGLTKFGVCRATGGRAQIVVLTINTAPTGNQTATITLNGVAFTVTGITSGTAQATAVQIAKAGVFTGWQVDQVDNTIVFLAESLGPKNGTYSFSSTGAGTLCTGSFSTKQSGVAQTEYWTYQDQFNVDRLDGTKGTANDVGKNPSGMTLRSQYLNVYQINFRWLGVGEIRYAIENELDGNMVFFHHEHYTNNNTAPHVAQPSFRIGYVAYNAGNASNATVSGASLMGAIEGEIKQNELNRSTSVNKTGLSQNVMHHLLTIRNPYVTNGAAGALNGNYVLNAKEIILKDVSIGTQNTDPAILYVFFEATTFSGTHSYFSQPKDNGMVSTADGTLDPTVDTPICQFVTAINGATSYPMRDFRVTIPPGSSVSFALKSTNAVSRATLALVFSED